MLLSLVRKDILIAKKYVLGTMAIIIAIPLFISYAAPSISGFSFICFLYMAVLGELMLLQAVSQIEGKYAKAVTLLCAAPYRRSSIVIAKYVFYFLMFVYCYVVYTLVMSIMYPAGLLDLTSLLTVLLISAVIYGVYMPVEFEYGFVKAKFLFMIIILLFSLGPVLFRDLLAGIDITVLTATSALMKNIVLAASSIVILGVSMMLSIKIFQGKEL